MDTSDADEMQEIGQALSVWANTKAFMLKEGLETYQTECPRCGNILHARLIGHKQHLHMGCEAKCGMQMLE